MRGVFHDPISPQSLVETIVSRLEAAIADGMLAPGERLSELALAKSMGVSRGPLREAIRRLEGRKLIERIPNVGARIASFSQKDLNEVLVIRESLEGLACRQAAETMTGEELAAIEALLLKHGEREPIRKGISYYQESDAYDLHLQIIRSSRNERLIAMLCSDLYHLLRVFRGKMSTISGRTQQAYAEHVKIVAALKARDPEAAEATMREHIRNGRLHAMHHFDSGLAPIDKDEQLLKIG